MKKAIRNKESKSCESKSVYITYTEAFKKKADFKGFSVELIDKMEDRQAPRGKSAQFSRRSKQNGST